MSVKVRETECPYEVKVSPLFGRYLIAARDLQPRELIISEEPIVQGPTDEPGDIPLCLGCCLKLTENQYSRCSKCHFPLCGLSCEQGSLHSANECKIFQENHVVYPPPHTKHILNKSIIILRCLLLKERNRLKFDQLLTMSDNRESRRNRPNCITADERILENLGKFIPHEKSFDIEEVLKLSGVLDVNAHAYPVTVNGKIIASKCHVYLKTSLVSHSCVPNCSWAPDKDVKTTLVIKTNIAVPKGSIISVAYTDSDLLYGTLRRLIPMEMSGMFICKCPRCLDETECGTFLSALKCQECPQGYLLSLNPTDSFSDWKCDFCQRIFDEIHVSEMIEEAERVVGFPKRELLTQPDTEEEVELLKEYVDEFSGTVLHPNHYIIQEVNLRIVRGLCYSLNKLGNEKLDDFLQRCKSLVKIADILTPGFCEYRAFLLYQYFRGLLLYQEKVPLQFNPSNNKEKEDLKNFLDRYKLILKYQEEVLTFLEEKFTVGPRIDYVRETMEFVKDQIRILEREKVV